MPRKLISLILASLIALPALAQEGSRPDRHYPGPQVEDRRYPLLPFQGKGELFDIPPGYERPVEVDEGEIIPVTRFVLSGIESEPEFAPFGRALLEILDNERLRVEQYNRDRLAGVEEFGDDDEFDDFEEGEEAEESDEPTEEELGQSTDDEAEAAAVSGQPTGMTIGQVQQAANLAAAYLREQGYFLAQAFIPEQTVVDGEVNILFLPGNLGQVVVENNRWYGSGQIEDLYEDMLGKPVSRRRLEWGILSMQNMPGLKSYATLVRGQAVGHSDLLVRIQEEDRHSFALSLDNGNLDETGAWQSQFDYGLNNLFGISDELTLTLRSSLFPSNNQFGSLSYDLPLSHTTSIYFNAYLVQYTIDADQTLSSVEGETQNLTTRFQWHALRSRYFNLYLTNLIDWTEVSTSAGDGLINNSAVVSRYSLSFSGDWVETRGSSLNTFQLAYSLALPGFLGADEAIPEEDPRSLERLDGDPEYSFLNLTYQRLQSLNNNNSILLKLSYSRSPTRLYSIHNTAVGGPDSFRALPSSALLRENVLLGTLEYILSPFSSRRFNDELTWGQVLQFSLFVDFAFAERAEPDVDESTAEEPDSATLGGTGLSIQFVVPDLVKVRFDYGYLFFNQVSPARQPINGDAPPGFDEYVYGDRFDTQPKSQFFFEVAYYF